VRAPEGRILHFFREIAKPVLRLGVGTPPALQRTALEKNRRPDARPVIDAELLDIKNQACLLHIRVPFFLKFIFIIADFWIVVKCILLCLKVFLVSFIIFY
jgi:hypothetical protein